MINKIRQDLHVNPDNSVHPVNDHVSQDFMMNRIYMLILEIM